MSQKESSFRRSVVFSDVMMMLLFSIAVSAIFYMMYIINTKFWPWTDKIPLGTLGDFVGGILNPIFTFLTFIGVLLTINLQSRELKLTRDEAIRSAAALEAQVKTIDKQNFESTFFQMLNLHHEIVSSVKLVITASKDGPTSKSSNIEGTAAFERAIKILKRHTGFFKERNNDTIRSDIIQLAYNHLRKSHRQQFAHYFRHLYNAIKFIDESNISNKERYMHILRDQLSDHELLLLMYTAMTNVGSNFKHYIVNYSLLVNLPKELVFEEGDEDLFRNFVDQRK